MPTVPEVREMDLSAAKSSLRLAGYSLDPDAAEWLGVIIVDGSRRLERQTFGSKRTRANRRRFRDARRSLTAIAQALADAQADMDAGNVIGRDMAEEIFAGLCPLPPWG
jgi:hypothetical protein